MEDQPEIKFVPKGWGFEKWIVNTNKYCGKLLYFAKGHKCSLHYHSIKDETFYIQSGKIVLWYSDELNTINKIMESENEVERLSKLYDGTILNRIVLKKGDNFYVPPGRVHQMMAAEDTELFEFSTQHFDTDSHRIIKGD